MPRQQFIERLRAIVLAADLEPDPVARLISTAGTTPSTSVVTPISPDSSKASSSRAQPGSTARRLSRTLELRLIPS